MLLVETDFGYYQQKYKEQVNFRIKNGRKDLSIDTCSPHRLGSWLALAHCDSAISEFRFWGVYCLLLPTCSSARSMAQLSCPYATKFENVLMTRSPAESADRNQRFGSPYTPGPRRVTSRPPGPAGLTWNSSLYPSAVACHQNSSPTCRPSSLS